MTKIVDRDAYRILAAFGFSVPDVTASSPEVTLSLPGNVTLYMAPDRRGDWDIWHNVETPHSITAGVDFLTALDVCAELRDGKRLIWQQRDASTWRAYVPSTGRNPRFWEVRDLRDGQSDAFQLKTLEGYVQHFSSVDAARAAADRMAPEDVERSTLSASAALDTLRRCNAPFPGNFHALDSSVVARLIEEADAHRYRHPKNANGSRARYFHAHLTRIAYRGER